MTSFEQYGTKYAIRAVDIAAFRAAGGAFLWSSGDESLAYDRLVGSDHPAVLMNAGFVALGAGLTQGGMLTLQTPNGDIAFEIVGTLLGGVSTDTVSLIMDRGLYQSLWGDSSTHRLSVQLAPDADVNALRRDFLRDYALRGVITLDSAEMIAAFSSRMTSIANVSSLMTSLFAVIIVAGLISTFTVFVLDRRGEIGLLRALGMTRRQIGRALLLEALLMLVLAVAVGLPVAYLGNAMQQVGMQRMLGIYFDFALGEVALTLLITLVVIVLSVWLPARSASQIDPLRAMRYE